MSLLSEYKGFGFVGGVDGGIQLLRAQPIQPIIGPSAPIGFGVSASLENNISYAISGASLDVGAPGYPYSILRYDFNQKKSVITRGPNVTNSYNQFIQLIGSPFFTGWYIDGAPFIAGGSDSVYYTNNYGSTYFATNLNSEKPASPFYDTIAGAYYWDGTNFGFVTNAITLRTTTNGTSFSTQPGTWNNSFFMGNNRSNYSGYWFGRIASPSIGYSYKISAASVASNVLGYYLTAMSPNGRYLQRIQTSGSYLEEYSTDGGASWTSFPTSSPYGGVATNQTYNQARRFCSNSGENFIMTKNGLILGYDFSTNTWVLCASMLTEAPSNTLFNPRNFLVEGVESLFVAITPGSGSANIYYMVDMPKLLT